MSNSTAAVRAVSVTRSQPRLRHSASRLPFLRRVVVNEKVKRSEHHCDGMSSFRGVPLGGQFVSSSPSSSSSIIFKVFYHKLD